MSFVYVIAFDAEGKFLMVKHHSRHWEMPGGRIEEGETSEEAAHREFLEETGMGVTLFDDTLPEGGGLVFGGLVGETDENQKGSQGTEVSVEKNPKDSLDIGESRRDSPNGDTSSEKQERRLEEILEVKMFSELPVELSFPRVEYEKMIKFFSGLLDNV